MGSKRFPPFIFSPILRSPNFVGRPEEKRLTTLCRLSNIFFGEELWVVSLLKRPVFAPPFYPSTFVSRFFNCPYRPLPPEECPTALTEFSTFMFSLPYPLPSMLRKLT